MRGNCVHKGFGSEIPSFLCTQRSFDYLSDAAHLSKLVVGIESLDGREPDA